MGRGPALTKRLPWATPGRGEGPANHIKGTPPLSEGGVRATTAGTLATPMSSSRPSIGQQSMVDKINGRGGEGQMHEPQPAAGSLHVHSKGTPRRGGTQPWPMLVIPKRMGQGPLVGPHVIRPARPR